MGETTNIDVVRLKDGMGRLEARVQDVETKVDRLVIYSHKIDRLEGKIDQMAHSLYENIREDKAEHALLRDGLASIRTGIAVLAVMTSVAVAAAGVKMALAVFGIGGGQ